jgi:GntR family transcriptional regulator
MLAAAGARSVGEEFDHDGTRYRRFDSIGVHVTEVHEAIRASMPTPDEARELAMGPGTPVFRITRTHWAGDRPVEIADITVPADRYVVEHTQRVSLTDDGDES